MTRRLDASKVLGTATDFLTSARKPILRVCFLGIILLAMTSGKAWADNLTLNNPPASSFDVMGNAYVGPYSFTDTTSGKTLQLDCDTYANEVYIGESWTISPIIAFSSLNPTSLPNTLLWVNQGLGTAYNKTLTTYQDYEVVAYLTEEMFNLPNTSSNATAIGDLQYALWDVFDSSASSGIDSNDQTTINQDLANAIANYNKTATLAEYNNYSNVLIYSPIPGTQSTGGTPQEYFGVVSTPEPSSFLLLGVGLMGLIMLARSKKSSALEQA
jgi:hypothetical protein